MKTICAIVLLFASATILAEEAPKGAASPPKTDEQSWTGILVAKPATAAENVVAALRIPRETNADAVKKGKRGADPVLYLVASGDVKTKLAELTAQGAHVKVTGTITAGTITVNSVTDAGGADAKDGKDGRARKRK